MGWTHLQDGYIKSNMGKSGRKNSWQSTNREAKGQVNSDQRCQRSARYPMEETGIRMGQETQVQNWAVKLYQQVAVVVLVFHYYTVTIYVYSILMDFWPEFKNNFSTTLKLKMRNNCNNSTISVNIMIQWSICKSQSPIHDFITRHVPRRQMSLGKIFCGHFRIHTHAL